MMRPIDINKEVIMNTQPDEGLIVDYNFDKEIFLIRFHRSGTEYWFNKDGRLAETPKIKYYVIRVMN